MSFEKIKRTRVKCCRQGNLQITINSRRGTIYLPGRVQGLFSYKITSRLRFDLYWDKEKRCLGLTDLFQEGSFHMPSSGMIAAQNFIDTHKLKSGTYPATIHEGEEILIQCQVEVEE